MLRCTLLHHANIYCMFVGHDLDQTDDLSDLSDDDAPLTPQDLEPAPLPRPSASKESPLVTSAQHIGQGEETKRYVHNKDCG